jgi:hypothetical protein
MYGMYRDNRVATMPAVFGILRFDTVVCHCCVLCIGINHRMVSGIKVYILVTIQKLKKEIKKLKYTNNNTIKITLLISLLLFGYSIGGISVKQMS